MFESNNKTVIIIRWAARAWSILPIFWMFSEIFYPHIEPDVEVTTIEYISLILLTISVGGLILAWVKEQIGAIISLVSLALFTFVFLWIEFNLVILIFYAGLGIPAGLFLLAGYLGKSPGDSELAIDQ